MDITYKRDNYQFILRTSIVIFNKDMSKILLFQVNDKNFYMLIGGKINELETSIEAIKREIKEEVNLDVNNIEFVCLSEEFINAKGYFNHQINIIYKGIYNDEIKYEKFIGLEGDWCHYEWIDIDNIDSYEIYPSIVKDIVKNPNKKYHKVDDLIRGKCK